MSPRDTLGTVSSLTDSGAPLDLMGGLYALSVNNLGAGATAFTQGQTFTVLTDNSGLFGTFSNSFAVDNAGIQKRQHSRIETASQGFYRTHTKPG